MRIKIIYYKAKFIIEPLDDNITTCLSNFADTIKIELKNLSFIYKGQEIDKERKLTEYKTKNLILLAYNLQKITHDKSTNDILCPGCNNPGIINIENDEANITKCKNNHINFDIPFKEFINMKYEFKEEKCGICGNEENLYGMPLEICSCKKLICPLCQLYHDPGDKAVNFYERFYLCSDHDLPFVSYCSQCNINLCEKCEEVHLNHNKVINKKAAIPSDAELAKIKSNAKEIKKYCEELKAEIKRIQMIFNKVVNYFLKNLEGYSILNNNILEWVKDLKNYETIKNIINLNEYNKIYKKNLSEILSLSINDKVRYLMKFYDEKRKELTIYYKNPKKDNFILFNNSFVDNNKNNCYIKIRNEKHELKERYTYSKNNINNEKDLPILKVKLIREKKLNLYKMFQGCLNLLSFDEDEFFFIWNVDKIIYFFSGCENLQNLPDLSVMNALNIADFSSIFHKCSALTSLPDISKWKTSNAKSMKAMFKECKNLLSFPDISKWETSNVQFMDEMFSGCTSLVSLPNISVWNTSSLQSLNEMFLGCKSLTSFPELTAWNTSNVRDMVGIFNECNTSIIPELNISAKLENESFLKPINFRQLWSKINHENLENANYSKFCEAFLIISLNKKGEKKIQAAPAAPAVPLSSSLPEKKIEPKNNILEDKPEVIFKYPLDIKDKFDLEDLAYSCFSTGIEAYVEQTPIEKKSFMLPFKNQYNEKFYLLNYFTYKKIPLEQYYSEYREKEENKENKKEEESETPNGDKKENPKGFAYIPFCFCLISKYFYLNQLFNCLKSIYTLFCRIQNENDYLVLRDLIFFLINSIPIPPLNKEISFMIPCIFDYIKLDCPIIKGYHLLNTNFYPVLKSFNISNDSSNNFSILYPLRILLNEKSLIIMDKNENRLTKFCDAYLSFLYPFEWIYTYIPILNEKNISKVDLGHPFLIGVNMSMIDKVEKLLERLKSKDDVFLLYVYDGYTDFDIGSSLLCSSNLSFEEIFKKTITDFPDTEIYWGIIRIMKEKSALTIKSYSNEAKIINRDFQKVLMSFYAEYIMHIEKTKEKKRKLFYSNLAKTKIYNNYIKNQYNEHLQYFHEFLDSLKKNKKKAKLNYDLNVIKEKYLINAYFSSINEKVENIKELQKVIREKFPEDKIDRRIFENDIELKEKDFKINNDKIYLLNE